MIRTISIVLGAASFIGDLEPESPATGAWLAQQLPFERTVLHARWSGEAVWSRLGQSFDLPPENATTYPPPGALLLYPGGVSEPELLIAYGACAFASRAGGLAGNHFASIRGDADALRAAGEAVLLKGRQVLHITRSA